MLLYNPLVAVAVTLLVYLATLVFTRPVPATHGRAFGRVTAILLLVAFGIPDLAGVLRLYEPRAYHWFAFPLALAVGVVVLGVLIVTIGRAKLSQEAPVLPVRRRDWWTFSSRGQLATGGAAFAAVALTCIVAGANSGWMTIAIPNGGSSDFFGWAYGLPVLGGAILVAVLAIVALAANARPAFARPETVDGESEIRRRRARLIHRIALTSLLVPLGAAVLYIGDAASGRAGVGIPGVGDFYWGLGFSSLAEPLLFAGRALQIAAVITLFLLLDGRPRTWRFSSRPQRTAAVAS